MKKIKNWLFVFSIIGITTVTATAVSCSQQENLPSIPPKLSEDRYVYDATNKYYESLDGLRGAELRNALYTLQSANSKKQTNSYADLLDFYDKHFRDKYYNNDNSIIDIYSEVNGKDPYTYPNYTRGVIETKKEGDGLNREHIIPQSWFGRNNLLRNDVRYVFPSDAFVNSERGTLPHDNVVSGVTKTFESGSKIGRNSENNRVFEPQDFVKGDIARAYLYFAFTYAADKDIVTANFFSDESPFIRPHFLETYTKWNSFDPIDEFNIQFNNDAAVFSNGIRNPFIDYPDLLESLFGSNPKPFVNKGVLASVRPLTQN